MIEAPSKKFHIVMRKKYGWDLYDVNNIKVWFCGHLYNTNIESVLDRIYSMLNNTSTSSDDVLHWIKSISGNFSFIAKSGDNVIAAVDKICTIPIFIVKRENNIFISNHAPILKKKCNIGKDNLNELAKLEICMSGYTIGNKTLYQNLERLEAGECLFYRQGLMFREFYYIYSPWKARDRSREQLKKKFTDICIKTLVNLKNSSNERQIVIPLSAGNDSRLVASGLKELGVEDVICFSYGRKGNFESPIGKIIADKLGYKWIYIEDCLKDKRRFFQSKLYNKFVSEFESYGSIPNVQEIYEISLLKNNPLISDDAIIVNGNSGDFISGGHIREMLDVRLVPQSRNKINWDMFLDKHYSLWGDKRTESNNSYIVSELEKALSLRNIESVGFKKYPYALMECMEFTGRQSRYVIGQQRSYEYFGYEWRMPLWSDEMLNFWESVPYKYKIEQNLYIEVLRENNWGSVWLDIKVNDKKVNPVYLRWLRILLKFLFIPIGKSKWHRFEKNVFEYFMHPSNALSVVPYLSILFDRRGYRNANSWLSHKMTHSKNR
ncbi:hypothetical protein HOO14_00355 [bacterium]|nr:hypothetical protein [bacterium]